MIKEYFLLSWKNLVKRRVRSWLTLIGVVIGIAAVISLIGLGEGLSNFVTAQFSVADTDIITITAEGLSGAGPPGTAVVDPLTDKELEAIRNTKGVDTAFGRLIESDIISFNEVGSVGFIVSVPEGEYRKDAYDALNFEIDEGRLLKDGDGNRIVVGSDFKNKDRWGISAQPGSKIEIGGTKYTVIGILEKKGSFIVDGSILMNENTVRDHFKSADDEYDIIAARAAKGQDINVIRKDIEKTLRKIRGVDKGEEDFSVETAAQALENLNSTLFAIQLFVYIIAGISLVVGGIGIMNTMYTAVLERTKDIGVMKAVGAKNSAIFTLFFIESGLIGMVGGLIGIMLGSFLAYTLAYGAGAALGNDMIRAHISLWLVIGTLLFSFVVGTIAGVLPAVRASRLSPVDALGYSH